MGGSEDWMDRNEKHSMYIALLLSNRESIFRFIVSMVPNVDDAEDLLQETSKLIWQKFDDYEKGTSFRNWAITIARYEVLGYYRSKQRNRVKFSSQTIDAISDCLSKQKGDGDRDLDALNRCVAKLSDKDRDLLEHKYAQKITTKQLAIQFGRSISGLYSTLARIHTLLVDCMQQNLR